MELNTVKWLAVMSDSSEWSGMGAADDMEAGGDGRELVAVYRNAQESPERLHVARADVLKTNPQR